MRELRACKKAEKTAPAQAEEKAAPVKPAEAPAKPAKATAPAEAKPSGRPSLEELKGWKVLALRSFVRKLPEFPLSPSEIRYANKASLMEALAAYYAAH